MLDKTNVSTMLCSNCKVPMLQFEHFGGGIYWTCAKCGCTVESTGTVKDENVFDLKRVFNYDTANKVKIGMNGYFADTVDDLKIRVEKEAPQELTEILPKECLTRYRNENGFVYELFYALGDVNMNEIMYCVENQYGSVIAKNLNMDNAMIFVRALFDHYFGEEDIAFTVRRQNEDKDVEK